MVKNIPDNRNLVNREMDLFEIIQSNIKFILSFIIISNFFIIYLLKFSIALKEKFESFFKVENNDPETTKLTLNNKGKDVLIIIAHPDDEIMFFGPTIKSLLKNRIKVRILCLSNGNFDGLGKIREDEFANVCKILRIEDYELINEKELQDDFKSKWNSDIVANKISDYLSDEVLNSIGTIVTFDEVGVTNHPNHISCSEGLMNYLKNKRDTIKEKKINSFILNSHNPISQYSLLFPFVYFYFSEFGFFNFNLMFNWRIMRLHASQFNLMRKIHVVFSAYTYFNHYTKIEFKQ